MPGDTTVVSFLWLLASVLVVIGMAYWFTRFVAGRGGFGPLPAGGSMKTQGQLALGRDQKLVLVQAGGRWFLLGVTGANISALAEFTEEEAAAWREAPETRGGTGTAGFQEALQKMLEQKGRR